MNDKELEEKYLEWRKEIVEDILFYGAKGSYDLGDSEVYNDLLEYLRIKTNKNIELSLESAQELEREYEAKNGFEKELAKLYIKEHLNDIDDIEGTIRESINLLSRNNEISRMNSEKHYAELEEYALEKIKKIK